MSAAGTAWAAAHWIGRPDDETREVNPTGPEDERSAIARSLWPAAYLRREFELARVPGRAMLQVSALGLYRVFVNGTRVGDEVLAPGWTDYEYRVHAQTFDVAPLLREGANCIALVVADGWYAGYVGFDRGHQARLYGEAPRGRLALVAGDDVLCVTDGSWRRGEGMIRSADLQMGEVHDPAQEPVGWREPGFDDRAWAGPALNAALDPVVLRSPAPPIRVIETMPAIDVRRLGAGRWLVDFGQNLSGVVRLRLRAAAEGGPAAGTQVHLHHAEVLDAGGEPYYENLRTAEAHDVVIADGGAFVFEPWFTFHGFRYLEVSGVPELSAADAEALVLHTDVARVGTFHSANPRIDRLYENAVWTVRGNLLDVPTDCPQRDERMGWLGDAGLIMPSAVFALDLDTFLEKWLADVRDAQRPNGAYPDVAPRANLKVEGAPGWADAGALIPWTAYLATGRLAHLEQNYDAMRTWLDLLVTENPSLVRRNRLNRSYGDWLNLDDPTPKDLLATIYLAYCAEVLALTASALGRSEDAAGSRELWERVRDAFAAEYLDADGRIHGGTQTSYAMALHLDLVPAGLRERTAAHFADTVERTGHLTTGIHGTRFLAPALSDIGRHDLAYRLLTADGYPSWLYGVDHGATTIWERWDGWTAERGFQDPRMNSFNHYALGSIAEWLHRYVAGVWLQADAPGFQHVHIRPYPHDALPAAGVTRTTPRGELVSRWRIADGTLQVHVEVPEGSSATIHVPAGEQGWVAHEADPGTHDFTEPWSPAWRPTPRIADDRLTATAQSRYHDKEHA